MIPIAERWSVLSEREVVRSLQIRVCHFMSADLWAGAEAQLGTVASYLAARPDIDVTAVLLNEGRLASELRAMGIEVAVVDEQRYSSAAIVAFLVRFLRAHDIHILHTHRYKDTVLGTLAAKLAGVPRIVRTVHGLPEPLSGWERIRFRTYSAVEKVALRSFADRVIAVSEDLARTLEAQGHRRSAVVPIHNGVDVSKIRSTSDRWEVRRQLGIPAGAIVFGTLGRLSAVKDHRTLLRAAQRVIRRQPNARFLIVGDGPLRDDLFISASELGVSRACVFAGTRDDVYDVLGAMDVFVLSSLHEGIPMALLEAMALGKPVVATGVGGVPEIVTHRENGLLVRRHDDRALAEACLEIAGTPLLASRLGSAARETIAEHFSHAIGGNTLVDVYRSLSATDGRDTRVSGRDLSAPRLAWELTGGLIRVVGRRASRAFGNRRARQEMNQIRRSPSRLQRALESASSILVVCHGNIIRSAFAGELLKQHLASTGVCFRSAGLAAVSGNPSHPIAVRIAGSRGIDLEHHAASPLDAESVAASDVVFVMDVSQLVAMRRRFPEARPKTFLLTCLAGDTPLEVPDPVDGDDPRFEACFDQISQAVRCIIAAMSAVPRVNERLD
jgi:L-malate glycosyltransferase